MTQQGVDMGRQDIQAIEITVPNTDKGFQDQLFAKLFYHWTTDFTNKIGFDVQRSGFAIENLPTCSSSPDFTLRCVFIMKNVKNDKINILHLLTTKYQLEPFFESHHVKMCAEIKWMSAQEKKKLCNTYRFGEGASDCITSSSWDRFRFMAHALTSWDVLLKRCAFDTDEGNDGDDDDGGSDTAADDDTDGKKKEVTISGTVSVNMDLDMSDDDDDDGESSAGNDDDNGGDDSGIENDNGGGDAQPSSAGGGDETAPLQTNSSSMPSSKHEKSNSSSSSSSSGFKCPSSFTAPIDIPSIPKGKISKLSIGEINKIKHNMMSAKSTPLRCSDPYLSLMATDCHKNGALYVHQVEYSDKTRNSHSVMYKQTNPLSKTRVGRKRKHAKITKISLPCVTTPPLSIMPQFNPLTDAPPAKKW